MEGKFIVIEGIDGSGKKTQAELLMNKLKEEGHKVKYVDFPRYNKWSSIFVSKYLNNELGDIEEVNAYQASLFYALDRYAASKEMKKWLKEGNIIVGNRYVSSNKGHQTSKIDDESEKEKFLDWLNELEYDILDIPKEDYNVFLDVEPKIAQELVDKKSKRNYLDKKKVRDLHEENIDHLIKSRNAYKWIMNKEKNWIEIDCVSNNKIKGIEEIHNEIWKSVKNKLL